jgi:hypothetical protein
LTGTVLVLVPSGVAHVVSLAEYRLKVIVPVGDEPPLSTAVSWIDPPSATSADAEVASAGVALAVADGPAGGVTGGVAGGGGQLAIVRFLAHEAEWPSRVWAAVHDDEAAATPLPDGSVTVSECELPVKETWPVSVVGVAAAAAAARAAAAAAGVKTIFQVGVLRPPLPFPDDANDVQWKVTEVHVAVAATVCAWAPAANTADSTTAIAVTVDMRASLVRERLMHLAASRDLLMWLDSSGQGF